MAEKTFHSITLPGQDTARVPLTAAEFSTSVAYKVKDYCTYQGKLYRCTTAHAAGAWNAAHFTATDVDAEFDRKLDIPASQASAPANPRVGDLWIDNDENSPIYNVDVSPTLNSTNAVQSGGTKVALNSLDSRKMEHGVITGDFSASVDYRVGDLVFYATTANGITTRTLYRCTTDHNSAAWNAAHFTATTLEVELQRIRESEADTDMIGDLFGAKTTYAVGDYCIYNDNLYRCIQAVDNTGVTTPAFDPDDWTQVVLANDVSDLKSAINDLGDEIVETKTVELLQAKILSYESYRDGSVVNNGDGSYTIGTTAYGSVEFGNQYLSAGKYRLFGSAVGFSYITIGQNNWRNPVASNDTNDYKEIELTEGGNYYIGHRTISNPIESFTIIPSLIYEYSVNKIDERFNEKANLIGNTPVSGTTIQLSALTINDDGTITHGTTSYGTIMLANKLVLQPGTYYLFGIDYLKGFGFVSEQQTVRAEEDVLVYNKSVIPKEFQIETKKTVYVGYRSTNSPSKPFTFKPELLIKRSKYAEQSALDIINNKVNTATEIGTALSTRFHVSLTEIYGRNMYPNSKGDLVENDNAKRGYTQIEVIPAKTIRVLRNENMNSVRVIVYERNSETRKWSSSDDTWHNETYEYIFNDNSDLFFVELDISNVTIPEGVNCINVVCLTVQNRSASRNYKSYMYEIYKDQATAFRRQTINSERNDIVAFKAMLVSDVHMQKQRMQNIVDLVNKWGTDYFDALINCGDTMNDGTEDTSWYYQMTDGLVVPSLNTVGNHDTFGGLTQNQTYDKIIAPLTSQSGIVQPENASTLGLCYYYHDFTKVRVIVVDCMHWDTAQATWFETVLADAQTNNLYVIACSHYGFNRSISTHIPSVWGVQDEATASIDSQAAEKVNAFITSGGTFICWLTGHEHGDNIHVLQNHGNQIVVSLPTLTQRAVTLWPNSDANAYNYDVMTYFAVDDYKKLIKFMRFGADIDMYGVKKSGVVLNYETGELVAAY